MRTLRSVVMGIVVVSICGVMLSGCASNRRGGRQDNRMDNRDDRSDNRHD